ncbi:ribonuclease D [Luteimonas sp. 50]|uniref:Ribonuclease D n=1 Tax=Cognatiluteimonas sedimenti TaxID=2927791 RepID=A0ABT0A0D6_9GAMM|nr:ribonuclease D [Lysobacter sedimenti]MCJ0824425.1 ribonuclease D [Lysobacter sedimenti]
MTVWIRDPAELTARLADAPPRVGLDTEFVRERTWWPQLALVQIALDDAQGSILLADPLAPGITDALASMLADPSVVKVMHSASEDLVALKRHCGVVPSVLFDTQVAAALAGVGAGVGYQRLVQDTLGVTLPKGETRSDWLRRPLSPAQLEYAADDVRHLFALHDDLDARLRTLGREAWLAEDCARMLANARSVELERWPHLSLRAAQFLDEPSQQRLLRLLRWRDAYAREADRPRSWILDNELATGLARNPPIDRAGLQRQLEATPKAPRSLGDALWQALQTPLPDEAQAPAARADDRDKAALRKLQDAVAALSAELGLPDGVLASRRWLQSLLDLRADGHGDDWPGPLAGWRRTLLEPRLAPLLPIAGDAAPAGRMAGGARGASV